MQQTSAWNFVAPPDNRLAALMKAYGCADVIAPVDVEAFGRKAGELIAQGGMERPALISYDPRKLDRIRPGGPPRVRMPSRA
jgi:hypothetical protein